MGDLHIFTDDYEWWIATSVQDVIAQLRERCGCAQCVAGEPPKDDDQDIHFGHQSKDWDQLADDSTLKVFDTDDFEGPSQTKTCAEWVAEKGRGFLCTTEC